MRVLFLVTDDWFFWSHRRGLACALRDAGGEVVVAAKPGHHVDAILDEGFAFEPVRFGRSLAGQLTNLGLSRRLSALYARVRPDVCHHVSFLPIHYGSQAARQAGVPGVVNAVTGLGRLFIDGRRGALRTLVERAYRRANRGASGTIGGGRGTRVHALFQNPGDRRLFLQRGLCVPEQSSVVFGSGVDVERFRPQPEPEVLGDTGERPVILFCARMLRSKGVVDLVQASGLLAERNIEHELVLVGEPHADNPDSVTRAELEAWSARETASGAGRVRWLGRRSDVPELMAQAHVVALPSYYREGVPMTLIEAAASGRAVVTTDTPGCREIVRHEHNGLLVPPRAPERLAEALGRLLRDPEERRRMGARGRALVEERFCASLVHEAVLGVYEELAGPLRSAGARLEEPGGDSRSRSTDGPRAALRTTDRQTHTDNERTIA